MRSVSDWSCRSREEISFSSSSCCRWRRSLWRFFCRCSSCDKCIAACPYGAIEQLSLNGREVAVISETGCKGCGGCVPVCPVGAIDLLGYTNAQILSEIDGMLEEAIA